MYQFPVLSVVLLIFLSIFVTTAVNAQPTLDTSYCTRFRRDLELHTQLSAVDRRDSYNLGISALTLSFIPTVPSLPLGISAIVLGARCNTRVRERMVYEGVSLENWQSINIQCASILGVDALNNVHFQGSRPEAINLGIASIVLTLLSTAAVVFFYFYEVTCCCPCCCDTVYDDDCEC